ncbi:MAG: DUF6151 family protein [Anaerolineae bacterium]|nr:DUF6151 family protein [Anaerolineae bacterium]MCO5194330.1 DUF6151 family protein [Anaerolineae bacterium]
MMIVSCRCGQVQLDVTGKPFMVAACYCDDCQAGWERIEVLENSAPVLDDRGGTESLYFRRDRVRVLQGEEPFKLKPESRMRRVMANCCNTAMFSAREDFRFTGIIRARFGPDAPPLEMRYFTRLSPEQPFVSHECPAIRAFRSGRF